MRLYRLRSRARKGAEKQESNLEAGSARPTPARSGLRALPYSPRLSVSAVKRSRARKGAEKTRFEPTKPGLHDQPRRAADCAPYRLSAPLGRWRAAILAAVTAGD